MTIVSDYKITKTLRGLQTQSVIKLFFSLLVLGYLDTTE